MGGGARQGGGGVLRAGGLVVGSGHQSPLNNCRKIASLRASHYPDSLPRDLAILADALRWQATPAERRLWHWLRKRPRGFKFRRQVVLGPYIVDFASCEARLVIEVDGEFHANQAQDVRRDAWLAADGWEVARYWNREVRFALEDGLADVDRRLAERPPRSIKQQRELRHGLVAVQLRDQEHGRVAQDLAGDATGQMPEVTCTTAFDLVAFGKLAEDALDAVSDAADVP